MFYKLTTCKLCDDNTEKPTVKGLCQYHYWNERGKTYKKKTPKRKNTGELEVFRILFQQRKQVCFLTGESLSKYKDSKMFHHLFHHVLPKGLYAKFRLNPKNIVMLKPNVHHDVENMAHSDLLIKYENYDKLLSLKVKLKQEYGLQYK